MKSVFKSAALFALSLSPVVIGTAFSPVSAFAQCQSCVNAVTLPTAAVTFSAAALNMNTGTQLASTGAGFIALTLSGVAPGFSVGNQTYSAWCGAWWSSAVQTQGVPGFPLFSTYAANLPLASSPLLPGNTLKMVNYILNHKDGTVQDVQDAIWLVMTGSASGIPSSTALALAAAGKANPAYIPNAGGVLAVFDQVIPNGLFADAVTAADYAQNLLIEILVPVVTSQGACSICVSGITLPATPVQFSSAALNQASANTAASTGAGFVSLTLTGIASGYSIANQTYSAWCGGWFSSALQTQSGTGFQIFSTYDPNFPAGASPVVSGDNFNMVNYILNHKAGTVQDVQDAIWSIVTGQGSEALSATAQAMSTAAKANPTYCPPAGGVIAMFMSVTTANLSPTAVVAADFAQNLIFEVICTGATNQGTPSLSLKKTANLAKVNPFQKVTYTYVVTNTGTVALTGIVVVDDNGTPTFAKDDFTVGTIASLAPGASATLTATIYPPVTEAANYDEGEGLNWGWNSNGNNRWDFDDNNALPGGTLICKDDGNGKVQFTYKEDTHHTDNSYGKNSSWDWGWWGHNFSSLASNDGAQFQILDKNANICLDFVADYVSPSSKFKSGYGTLGVKGGGGAVYKGSSSSILSVETSLSHNLNSQTKYSGNTKDSPVAGTPDWDFDQSYTVTIDSTVCGKSGFGGIKLPITHNYPAKWSGCDARVMRPTSSTVVNTAVASVTVNGVVVKASAKATVTIDASRNGWSQCTKY